jgi:hypothetical protein
MLQAAPPAVLDAPFLAPLAPFHVGPQHVLNEGLTAELIARPFQLDRPPRSYCRDLICASSYLSRFPLIGVALHLKKPKLNSGSQP